MDIRKFRWLDEPIVAVPAPADCPDCVCHTAHVCQKAAWDRATQPQNADGTPYTTPCPCRAAARPAYPTQVRGVDGSKEGV